MFERFTEEARRAIVFAQEEAASLGHERLGTEHLLLGVIREGSLASLFNQFAVTLERARMAVRRQATPTRRFRGGAARGCPAVHAASEVGAGRGAPSVGARRG